MEHRMQIQKNLEGIASGAPLPFANLLKRAPITFGAVAKGNLLLF